jgi:F-type H+-transporting ATPase subunit b
MEGGAEHAAAIPWGMLGLQLVNLVLFAAILLVFARRPVMDALKDRAGAVRKQLEEAARLRDDAEARYADVDQKLQALDRRIEAMKAEAAAEAEAEGKRILERAEADAARVKETAERTIREEAERARTAIRREAVAQAAQLARARLESEISPEDQERLAQAFLARVQNGSRTGGGEA